MAADSPLGDRIRARRRELKLTLRELADRVDVSFQHLSDIERGRTSPSVDLIYKLGEHLGDVSRLVHLLRDQKVPQGLQVANSDRIKATAHLFYPALFSADKHEDATTQRSNPLQYTRAMECPGEIPSRLHVYPYRVALVHEAHSLTAPSLQEIARWRAIQIARKDDAVRTHMKNLNLPMEVDDADLYCLACFSITSLPWGDPHIQDRAVQLLACPSVLLYDKGAKVADSDDREESLLHGTGSVTDLIGFGMSGSHIGWAAWAGVAMLNLDDTYSIEQDLVDLELSLQSIWCYANNVEHRGRLLSPSHGAEFLRLARRRLTQPKSTEHTSMRLLREAIVQTSRVTQVIEGALDALAS